jgi:adenosylcobinamide-GDP ribazoletransferase
MKKEWHIFLTAVMFLTRIQVPPNIDHSPEYLQRSSKYFPLVGWIVGGISILTYLVTAKFFSENIAILSSMIASILTTGAFHEDGFADTCDAFGGGWTKEKILMIMKDSRLGTYGVVGILFILGAKFLLLQELPKFTPPSVTETVNPLLSYKIFIGIILAAHSVSRLMAVSIIQQYQYVTDEDVSKSKPLASKKLSLSELLLCVIVGILPFLLLPLNFLLIIIPVVIGRIYLAAYFRKWIGGYTGDCLGAVQQVTEIIFYLSALILWKYF